MLSIWYSGSRPADAQTPLTDLGELDKEVAKKIAEIDKRLAQVVDFKIPEEEIPFAKLLGACLRSELPKRPKVSLRIDMLDAFASGRAAGHCQHIRSRCRVFGRTSRCWDAIEKSGP